MWQKSKTSILSIFYVICVFILRNHVEMLMSAIDICSLVTSYHNFSFRNLVETYMLHKVIYFTIFKITLFFTFIIFFFFSNKIKSIFFAPKRLKKCHQFSSTFQAFTCTFDTLSFFLSLKAFVNFYAKYQTMLIGQFFSFKRKYQIQGCVNPQMLLATIQQKCSFVDLSMFKLHRYGNYPK